MAPSSRSAIPPQVHDFCVLPLRLTTASSFPKDDTIHYTYIRANAPKVPTDDTPRELFLVNIPIDATESQMCALFADQLGGARVEEVGFEDARVGKGIKAPVVQSAGKKNKKRKRGTEETMVMEGEEVGQLPEVWDRAVHRTGGTAVVRFVDRQSAELALKESKRATKAGRPIEWNSTKLRSPLPPLGSARYLSHHRLQYPDPAELQTSVDFFMAAFAEQEAERAQQLARQRAEPDEDGFITVTRGGRNGPAREDQTKAKEEELRKREKNRVKDDFYRFQVREKMKERAHDLVKGFEQDQRKVDEMRRRRGRVRPE